MRDDFVSKVFASFYLLILACLCLQACGTFVPSGDEVKNFTFDVKCSGDIITAQKSLIVTGSEILDPITGQQVGQAVDEDGDGEADVAEITDAAICKFVFQDNFEVENNAPAESNINPEVDVNAGVNSGA